MSEPTPAPATPVMATPPPQAPIPIEAYYESWRKNYFVTDAQDNWMQVDMTALKLRLAKKGYRGRAKGSELLSPADSLVVRIQNEKHVQYAGALAGFKRGLHKVNEAQILVTSSPKIPPATPGDWGMTRKLINQQLEARLPNDIDQTPYLHTWLKLCDEQLRACLEKGHVTYRQAMILVGPVGCGKSLLQLLFTQLLGGRSASPFKFMSGGTEFNHELFQSEHLCIQDEQPHKDYRSRIRFADAIKQVTAKIDQPYYGKNKDGRTLTPWWALSISANDEHNHIEVLPPLDDIRDKCIILHCRGEAMPMPAGTEEEKAAFWAVLMEELPHYLHWLRHEFVIPAHLRGGRYGLLPFCHPRIEVLMADLLPETRLLALIDHILFMDSTPFWHGTAEELSRQLTNCRSYGAQARTLVSNSQICGRLLSNLSKMFPKRVQEDRQSHHRYWHLTRPEQSLTKMTPAPPSVQDDAMWAKVDVENMTL